ncbi:putative bifunctional diguanylate cyclase/phosphodiesterase [Aquisalimonas asiatica]|uniref:Diguanylate cyclase (GGDEF) domain-containing protein n=1 Tax=Aquisalimonas asiatica TaxID=406100 RepID=A0A1H8Q3W8_9GAMM|nr:EAL domain-containing protein [Aquisalimonas asiatica]SEO48945.1 diguanylate cyclase (GGDEF) domain-containing protein [Aquisalimonas asiatica]
MQFPDWVRHRRLSVKLVIAIVLLSSMVTLVVTSIQVLIEYRRDVHGLEQGLSDARSSFSRSLGASLWALDESQLTLQLRGLHQLPHVDRVELTGDMALSVGEPDGYTHRHEKTFPVSHRTADGVRHPLGEVRIDASLAAIHSRLWDRLTVILASQAFKTFVVSTILLALIYYLVIRHLQSLAGHARAIRLERPADPVLLSRPEHGFMRPDELDDVASAMNHAVSRMAQDMRDLRAAEERLDYRTHFDMLTGLPNRHLMQQLLTATIGSTGEQACAVVLLDVDRFKAVNESIGPEAGDDVLRTVATLLRESTPADWQVGRFGNDEFVIVIPGAWRAADLRSRTGQLLQSLGANGKASHLALPLSATAGIALCPEAGRTAPELLRAVDSALQAAKQQGAGSVTVYDPMVQQETRRQLMLDADLHRALANGEFHLLYQPIVDPATATVVAVEALARWEHPDQGTIPPDTFIGLAEDNGLIVPLGEWVLRQALADIRRLRALPGRSALRTSVNVSPAQLVNGGFAAMVETALAEKALPGDALQLEITERTFLTNVARSRQALQRIEALGIKITIDDFGTGYSALNQLRRLPVNGLKIDRAFIRDMLEDPQDAQLVRAITSLADGLGLEVTAEGVETDEQLQLLRELGCDLAQGFLVGRPQPLSDLMTHLGHSHDHA